MFSLQYKPLTLYPWSFLMFLTQTHTHKDNLFNGYKTKHTHYKDGCDGLIGLLSSEGELYNTHKLWENRHYSEGLPSHTHCVGRVTDQHWSLICGLSGPFAIHLLFSICTPLQIDYYGKMFQRLLCMNHDVCYAKENMKY